MHNMLDSIENAYLNNVCNIQDQCIKGLMSKTECEQKLEIERCKYINSLHILTDQLDDDINREKMVNAWLEVFTKTYKENK